MASVASATKEEIEDAMGDQDQWSNLVLSREAFQVRAGGSGEASQAERGDILLNCGCISNSPQSFFLLFIFISWRLVTLQYCSGFCHTLTWISHGFTCVPHPDPPSHLPLPPSLIGIYFTITSSLCQEFRQGTTGWLFSTPVSGASVGRLKGWGLESSKSLITHLSGGLRKLLASGLSSPLRGLLWMVSPHGSVWASSGSKGKHPKKESLVEAAPFFLLAMLGLHWWFKGTSLVVGTSLIMTCRLCCPVACRILVPWPRIEPMTPALQDRFLTTGPPRKSQNHLFWLNFRSHSTSLLLFFHLLRQSKKFHSTSREEETDSHLFMGDSKVLEEHVGQEILLWPVLKNRLPQWEQCFSWDNP